MRVFVFICLAFFSSIPSVAKSDWIDNFTGGVRQQSWTFGALPGGSVFSDTTSVGQINISSPNPITGVAGGGAAAVFGFVNTQQFTDVSVRGLMNPGGANNLSDNIGLIARLNPTTQSGYVLTMDFGSNNTIASLDLTLVTNGVEAGIGTTNFTFTKTSSYFLQLDVIGTQLTGRVFDSSNVLITTVNATNASLASGFSGIVAQRLPADTTPLFGTYGQMSSITAVPEPSSILLCCMIGFGGLAMRRKAHRATKPV